MTSKEEQIILLALAFGAGLALAFLFLNNRCGPQPLSGPFPGPTSNPVLVNPNPHLSAFYQNEESWELKRDSSGRLANIVVHRDAHRAN